MLVLDNLLDFFITYFFKGGQPGCKLQTNPKHGFPLGYSNFIQGPGQGLPQP